MREYRALDLSVEDSFRHVMDFMGKNSHTISILQKAESSYVKAKIPWGTLEINITKKVGKSWLTRATFVCEMCALCLGSDRGNLFVESE